MKTFTNLMSIVLLATLVVFGTKMVQARDDRDAHHGKEPLQVQTSISMRDGTPGIRVTMFTVPKNKRLTVEYVSCDADIPGGQFIAVGMDTNGGGLAHFTFLATKVGTIPVPPGEDVIVISQQVRIFADPGTEVQLTVNRSAATGGVVGGCAFAGQLREVEDEK